MTYTYKDPVDIIRIAKMIALAEDEIIKAAKEGKLTREKVLGLEFNKGDKVIDKITKKGGEILAGTRKNITVPVSRSKG